MNNKCRYFDECSAPMCPMCESLEQAVWFADEEICRLREVPDWVKRQRKIAKTGVTADAGCFTLPMLEQHCYTSNKIKGITPEAAGEEKKEAEKDWLNRHKPIKKRTDDDRERLAAQMRFIRGKLS